MSARIQRFSREHLDPVAALENQAGDTRWSRAQFEKELKLPMSRFYVITSERGVFGYGGFWKVEREAQMTNLAIHPEERNQGFGTGFLQYLMDQARREGCARITLEVRIGNQAARTLYEGLGFRTTGRRPAAYVNPDEDALLMEKIL